MNEDKIKTCAATIILAVIATGTEVESPYDIENFLADHLTSEVLRQFFYGADGEKLKVLNEICKVREQEFKRKLKVSEDELKGEGKS